MVLCSGPVSTPMAPIALPPTGGRQLLRQLRPFLLFGTFALLLWGRVPAFLSPTVNRTLYFKLPIEGTRFHWTFGDRLAFEAGELTLRIVNTKRGRDQTIVIFRHGQVSAGWEMIAAVTPAMTPDARDTEMFSPCEHVLGVLPMDS